MPEQSQKIFIVNSTVGGDISQFIGNNKEIKVNIEPELQLGDYNDFVGREDELNWLRRRFENVNSSKTVLTGGAGVGKTFLAGVFASTVSFPNGYLTVFVGDRKVEEISFQILRYFDYRGDEPTSPNQAKDLLRQYLANTFDGLLTEMFH